MGKAIFSKNNKPPWKEGRDFPAYSGVSWTDLQDIYPRDKRIQDDIWRVIGLVEPAWILTTEQCVKLVGEKIPFRDFRILCFMQRCEDAKDAIGFVQYPVMKGLNIGGTIYYRRQSVLTKLGLIEKVPMRKVWLFRVTTPGKILIKHFVENLRQADENIHLWLSRIAPETQAKITRALTNDYPGWQELLGTKEQKEPSTESTFKIL